MIEIVEEGIVYANPKPYLRTVHAVHPTIVDLGGGELLCAFSLAQAQESVDHLGYQSRSFDNGKTWAFEGRTIPVDTVRPSSHTVRLSETKEGLVGFGGLFWRDDPEVGMIADRSNFGFVPMNLFVIRSGDRGQNWSWPEIITPPLVGPAFEICHNIVELSDGRWLAPCSTQRMVGEPFLHRRAVVLISDDKGRSWDRYGVVFDGTDEGVTHYELSVCSLGGRSLLAVAWAYHEATGSHLPNRFAFSHDGGLTFSKHGDIGIDGQTVKAIGLNDGRILLAYRRNDRPGLWAAVYNIEEHVWALHAEKLLWDGGLGSSGMLGQGVGSDELSALKFGFPQMVDRGHGEVYVVFWCFEDWSCRIRWIRLNVSDKCS